MSESPTRVWLSNTTRETPMHAEDRVWNENKRYLKDGAVEYVRADEIESLRALVKHKEEALQRFVETSAEKDKRIEQLKEIVKVHQDRIEELERQLNNAGVAVIVAQELLQEKFGPHYIFTTEQINKAWAEADRLGREYGDYIKFFNIVPCKKCGGSGRYASWDGLCRPCGGNGWRIDDE